MTDEPIMQPTILLVDDEEDLVSLLARRFLKRGMNVVTATSGRDALNEAKRRRFDVALIDLKMPGMDGVAVMQELKVIQPFLEMIMFTGHGSTESALEAGKLEAYRYVMKPCPFDELVVIITDAFHHRRALLREQFQAEMQVVMRTSATPNDILAAGDHLRHKYEQN